MISKLFVMELLANHLHGRVVAAAYGGSRSMTVPLAELQPQEDSEGTANGHLGLADYLMVARFATAKAQAVGMRTQVTYESEHEHFKVAPC